VGLNTTLPPARNRTLKTRRAEMREIERSMENPPVRRAVYVDEAGAIYELTRMCASRQFRSRRFGRNCSD
jgi:hypothetical protein